MFVYPDMEHGIIVWNIGTCSKQNPREGALNKNFREGKLII